MPRVTLGQQAYARSNSFNPEVRLVNLIVENDDSGASLNPPPEPGASPTMLVQRPGLTVTAMAGSPIRGIYQSDNSICTSTIVVAGASWAKVDGSTLTTISTVPNDGDTVRMDATAFAIGLLTAGQFYIWNGTTVTNVAIRDTSVQSSASILTPLPTIVDVAVLDNYFILTTESGTFYWIIPGETSVYALSFASAEALPDGTRACRRLRDDLYFFGSSSIEVWQATGDPSATFARALGRLIDRGMATRDTLTFYDNTFVWLGDDFIVYRLSTVPTRISTLGIEDKIKARTNDCSAFVFTSLGHKFYVLKIPGVGDFAYYADTGLWCEFSTIGATNWAPTCGTDTGSGPVCADQTGRIYRLDPDSSLDNGTPFLRLVTGNIPVPAKPAAINSLAVAIGSHDSADITLRFRDPRRDWSNPITRKARGGSDIVNFWRLGAAKAPTRTFEISTVAPTQVRISSAMANETWRPQT